MIEMLYPALDVRLGETIMQRSFSSEGRLWAGSFGSDRKSKVSNGLQAAVYASGSGVEVILKQLQRCRLCCRSLHLTHCGFAGGGNRLCDPL